MALTNCPNCGNKVSTRAEACPHCGEPLNSAPKTGQTDNPKKKSKGLIIALISVLGLGVLGGGGWALYKYVIKPNSHHHNLDDDDDKSNDEMSSFEDSDSITIDTTDISLTDDLNQYEYLEEIIEEEQIDPIDEENYYDSSEKSTSSETMYFIVISSKTSFANAKEMVDDLGEGIVVKGYSDGSIRYRVCLEYYATKSQAQANLGVAREYYNDEAWVLTAEESDIVYVR